MRATRSGRIKTLVGGLAVAALATACGPKVAGGPAPCAAPSTPTHPVSSAILNQVNADRARSGLPGLAWNRQLYCLATDWSQQMAASGDLHHRDLNTTIRSAGYEGYRTLGENVLRGPPGMTGEQMEAAWMASLGAPGEHPLGRVHLDRHRSGGLARRLTGVRNSELRRLMRWRAGPKGRARDKHDQRVGANRGGRARTGRARPLLSSSQRAGDGPRSSCCSIRTAAASADSRSVATTTSGCSGGSYGSSMPVKPVSSPARAFA